MRQAFDEKVHVLLTWIYSTLVNVSGLMNASEVAEYPPLAHGRMPRHLLGFQFAKQIAR